MTTKKEVAIEIDYLLSIKDIMETYEEISALRMQHIRSSVLQSRDFLLEINSIFQQVKASYKNELLKKKKIKDKNSLSFINNNGKTLLVLLCANTGLYGDIIRRTFELFAEVYKKEQNDVCIIGKVGLQFFQEQFGKADPPTYFELPDDKLDQESLKKITDHLIQYEKIVVFYGQFQTVISQKPVMVSISGDRLASEEPAQPEIKYFFEPYLEKIMEFFEKEILASIFEQTLYESQLAKFASRMVSLNAASDNTKTKLKKMIFEKEKIKHRIMNKKQTGVFASRLLWQEKYYG